MNLLLLQHKFHNWEILGILIYSLCDNKLNKIWNKWIFSYKEFSFHKFGTVILTVSNCFLTYKRPYMTKIKFLWNVKRSRRRKCFRRNIMPSSSDIESRNTATQIHIPEKLNVQHRYIILHIDNIQPVRPTEQVLKRLQRHWFKYRYMHIIIPCLY
jgi:hypothetical protein